MVLDTNVIVAALRSSLGASHAVLLRIADGVYRASVSVPLVLEYEKAVMDTSTGIPLSSADKQAALDFICAHSEHQEIHYLWRPQLRDPGDEMVLEAAVAAGCRYIVTHNVSDFEGSERFGVRTVTPGEFLRRLGDTR